MHIKIAPSILAADFARLGEQAKEAEAAGAELLHVDVMDGRFVPNITLGPVVIEALRRSTKLPLDVHLMIVEPERHIEAVANAGATSITVHIEAAPHVHRVLQMIRAAGCKAGVALNPHTPASTLAEILHMIDVIIVMTVNPGWGGQDFLPETMPKVARLRAMLGEARNLIDLEVDGGINTATAVSAVQAGANVLIAGTTLFEGEGTMQQKIAQLRQSFR
jgi:ribulose-phosphate 3-epimerase